MTIFIFVESNLFPEIRVDIWGFSATPNFDNCDKDKKEAE